MVGDVNIFLTDPTDPTLAELEIMIAGEAQYSFIIVQKQTLIKNLSVRVSLFCAYFTAFVVFFVP